MVARRRLAWWLRGTNQHLLWNPNDRSSVEGGSTVADGANGDWTTMVVDRGGAIEERKREWCVVKDEEQCIHILNP